MSVDAIVGSLVLRPGRELAVRCERPMVGSALLDRLAVGRLAVMVPDIMAAVFALCAESQRATSRRAIRAALGIDDAACGFRQEARVLALHVAREHLQRFALDLPTRAPVAGAQCQAQWLREAPVIPLAGPGPDIGPRLAAAEGALRGWLERRLFGMAPEAWWREWLQGRGGWLERWCARHDHPLARWLAGVRDDALATGWPCRRLDALVDLDTSMRDLAASVAADPAFPQRPLWRGEPAETGPWARAGDAWVPFSVWDRLGARLAELARIGAGLALAVGALRVGDGEAIAWTEMSRGLLLHWVRLGPGASDARTARPLRYQVFAPTEWNFHPDGAFARLLQAGGLGAGQVGLAAAALDPCVAFHIEEPVAHA